MFGNLFNQKRIEGAVPQQELPQQATPSMPQAPAFSALDEQSLLTTTMNPDKRENVTALSRLDPRMTQVLYQAQQEATRIKQAFIEPDQLLVGLLYDGEIFRLLEQFSLDSAKISHEIQRKESEGTFTGQPTLSSASQHIFEEAYNIAKTRASSFISPEDVLIALFSHAATADLLKSQGVEKQMLEDKLSKSAGYALGGKKSTLEKFGIDLTDQAKQGFLDPLTGRDRELERLMHILLRRTKNNPIIIGEAGVGKTAIVEALAQKIVAGDVPQDLKGKRIIQLEVSSLVAGASHRGEFEERLRTVIHEVQALQGVVILFIDEIHTVMGTGGSDGALDASNIIKPFLARGQLQMIGTTTTAEFRRYFEKDKAFERRFQPIIVDEPSEEIAVEMLRVLKPKYEKFHSVVLSDEALEAAVKLSKKYIGERFLPDKAVDLLDEAAADVKLLCAKGSRKDNAVIKSDIEKVVAAWTGIPITKLTEDESEKLLHLEELIHKRLIDQEEAVVAVSEAVRRGRIGLASGQRPIASFMFLGPTGTGKTELAKTLAEILFGRDDAMIRLDMSEYMEKHEVAKLIGAPPGYVGYEEGGQLTEAVRARPYSIVLLDEVEKAHPDVFNILLQVLEDGRLTDNKGNTISFKNTVIIATSNIGSVLIQQQLSLQSSTINSGEFNKQNGSIDPKKFAEIAQQVAGELHKFFRPEFLNRLDEIVIFKPLSQKDMTFIAKLGIQKTQKLLKEQGFGLEISDSALGILAQEGYDPVYGARPLRRLIQTAIENPIALLIIGKAFVANDIIYLDYDAQKQHFTFVKLQKQTAGQSNISQSAFQQDTPAPQPASVPPQPSSIQQPIVKSNTQFPPAVSQPLQQSNALAASYTPGPTVAGIASPTLPNYQDGVAETQGPFSQTGNSVDREELYK